MGKLVSVIVPMHNAEKYIERCLNSLLKQSYSNIEIIVIDDGSKDASFSIVKAMAQKDNRIQLFSKQNGGVSAARNFGIEKAIGEYIVFVDSDDYVAEKYVENLYEPISLDTNIEFAVSGFYFVYNENQKKSAYEDKIHTKEEILLFNRWGTTCWGKIFKRKIINENNLKFNEEFCMTEDTLFLTEYLLKIHGKAITISYIDYYYDKTHESATSSRFNVKNLSAIKAFFLIRQKVYDYIQVRWQVEAAMFSYTELYYFEMYKEKMEGFKEKTTHFFTS